MLSEPRTISMLCEIVHIPMKHRLELLREVYNRVCKTCGYENFIRTPSGARIERPGSEGGFSHLNFTGDRIQFTEDHMGISPEQFSQRVGAALKVAVEVLRIPVILVQQTTVRLTTTPNSHRSAAEFLSGKIFQIRSEDLESFGRPTNVFGFRLVFPATGEQPGGYNVRIESYMRDARSLYIENVGTFKTPLQVSEIGRVEKGIQATSDFLVENVVPFLSGYDRRD